VKWFSAQQNLISKGLTYLLHVKPTGRNGLFTTPMRTRQNCLVWSASAVWT